MEKKLFVSDDSPAELKETISVCQQYIDNMQEFKVKADNGTLNFDDLEELTRRNNILVNQLPHDSKPRPGYPPQTTNLDELESYAKTRGEESANLLKAEGGPVFKITSFDELKKLSKMEPEALGAMILEAGKKKTREKEEKEAKSKAAKPEKDIKIKTDRSFHEELLVDHLHKIKSLLLNAKLVFFNLQDDWEHSELFEEKLIENAKSFEDFRQDSLTLLKEILTEEDVDDETIDKQQESAFILATIETEDQQQELKDLIDIWKADEGKKTYIVQALKYAKNSTLSEGIQSILLNEIPSIQAGLIEILEYRSAVDSNKWNMILRNQEPMVSSKIYRAYSNSGIEIENITEDFLLDDPEADYFEDAVFSALLSGKKSALYLARKQTLKAIDKICDIPLAIACAGDEYDIGYLKDSFVQENAKKSSIMALGILGLVEAIPLLISAFSDNIQSKEEWELQVCIVDSLNLITGANMPMPFPEIKEGPEGKEYEITIETGLKDKWAVWWHQNRNGFIDTARYRRGKHLDFGVIIDEMAYPRGNYWSRQYAYYELQIRSGQHIAPFFADWYVKDQKASIEKWRLWWQENKEKYGKSQWLYYGKPPVIM